MASSPPLTLLPLWKLFSYFSPPPPFIIYLRWPRIILSVRRSISLFLRSLMSLHCLGDQLDWWRPLTAGFDMRSLTAQWVFIRFFGQIGRRPTTDLYGVRGAKGI